MPTPNQQTLQSYEEHFQEYIDGTPSDVSGYIKQWIDESLKKIPKGGSILELGSGYGRDADYIQSLGYKIMRTDGAAAFVEAMKRRGIDARILNIVADDIIGKYDMVFANAVLLHLTIDEFRQALGKIHEALNVNGVFSFSVQLGDKTEWKDNRGGSRFFQYWSESAIREELTTVGFNEPSLTRDPAKKWLHVTTAKA